jgi:hypothetical protein
MPGASLTPCVSMVKTGGRCAPENSLVKELRLLCRDEVGLIEQRSAFINQLRHALAEYYPTALEAFTDWGAISAWMFLQRFPTPHLLEKAGKRQWEKFLHSRHLWRNESGPQPRLLRRVVPISC